ncbi:MAG: hypothetical protein IJ645_05720 [Ruminococcus sp.]|nr:hypothetical protein [Ruminococcus sp.]
MESNIKFEIELISFEDNTLNLQYQNKTNEIIKVKTMRLHNTSIKVNKPEFTIFRSDELNKNDLKISLPLEDINAKGVTFVVRDETHNEQYSVGIDLVTKTVNIKEMHYGG